jgi:uncharacterized protein (TIGR02996 family)
MLSDRLLLLRAIRANPDDDTPRLIYADWLQENGEDARAEFIRLQIHEPRAKRVSELFHANWRAWVPHVFKAGEVVFARGFIEQLHVECERYFYFGESLFREGAISRVRLSDRKPLRDVTPEQRYFWCKPTFWPQLHGTWTWSRHTLPPPIFDMIDGVTRTVAYYPTVQRARQALAKAALAYGRNLLRAAEERGDA